MPGAFPPAAELTPDLCCAAAASTAAILGSMAVEAPTPVEGGIGSDPFGWLGGGGTPDRAPGGG